MNAKISFTAKILFVIILVYCFLVSIGLMGAAFKGFGKGFAETLISSTSNPFIGLFIGVLATSLVQSSSTTTSIVVGMVGSGVLTVNCAIPLVMGANIGTTVTNTIVSLGHVSRREEFKRAVAGATVHDFFNLICVSIMFPLNLATGFLEHLAHIMATFFTNVGGFEFTSPVKAATKPAIHGIEFILAEILNVPDKMAYIVMVGLSLVILFVALIHLVKTMRSLVIEKVEAVLDDILGKNAVLAIASGALLTAFVQSSSITTSLMVPMIAAGILSLEAAFPIVIGANIGTTGTAILASFATGSPAAIVIAFVHFLFNLIGAVAIYPVPLFRRIPLMLAKELGNLAYEKRRYAILYVLGMFFVMPGLLVLVHYLMT